MTRGWIGVQIQPVTAEIADSLGLKNAEGALVAEPQADGPAAKAGIVAGDVITAVNGDAGQGCARPRQADRRAWRRARRSSSTVWRKGEEKTVSLTLGELPKRSEAPRHRRPTAIRAAPTCRSSA